MGELVVAAIPEDRWEFGPPGRRGIGVDPDSVGWHRDRVGVHSVTCPSVSGQPTNPASLGTTRTPCHPLCQQAAPGGCGLQRLQKIHPPEHRGISSNSGPQGAEEINYAWSSPTSRRTSRKQWIQQRVSFKPSPTWRKPEGGLEWKGR